MAHPIAFKPVTVDFEADLRRRLDAVPDKHAAALLAACEVIEAAHQQGLLDLLHGMIGSKDAIVLKLSGYASLPEGVAAIRNLLTAAKILTELDPEVLGHVSRAMSDASSQHKQEQKPPSLWQLFRRATSEDSRRGLSLVTLILSSLGRSLGQPGKH